MEEKLTGMQIFAFIITFLIGETLMAGANTVLAEQNEWVAQIAALVVAILLFAVYIRPFKFFPDRNIFEILNTVLGAAAGRIIGIIFIAAAFANGVFVLRLVAEFVVITGLDSVPLTVLCLIPAAIAVLMVMCGVSRTGRVSFICLPFLLIFTLFYIFAAIKNIYSPIFRPDFTHGIMPILRRGFEILNCPFSQVIFLVGAMSMVKGISRNKKWMWAGFIIGGIVVVFAAIRNVFVLGSVQTTENYFPSYITASLIEIGDFFRHAEIFVAVVLFCSNIIQIATCIACVCGGICQTFNLKDYKKLALPVGVVMAAVSIFAFGSMMSEYRVIKQAFKFFSVAIIAIPIVFWIIIEVYGRVKKLPENRETLNEK